MRPFVGNIKTAVQTQGDQMKQSLEKIAALFDSQRLGVLSTQNRSQPYASLVAFAASDTLGHLFF